MPITILLVDDDPIQAATRKAILIRSGNEVVIASGGQKALSLLDDMELAQRVGMVITDHLMPGMNGLQFVTELRRHFPTLPVLVLSGLPDGEAAYEGLNVRYRLKPLAPEELIQLAQSIPGSALGRTA
jgi:DNA-binding response OmpR family regulator